MLSLPYTFQYYFYNQPTDMRNSFNGLQSLIMDQFDSQALPGKIFVFLSKRKDSVKVFYWDNDGFAIWYKRLEKGLFKFPSSDEKYMVLSSEILQQIFLGFDTKFSKKLKRFSLDMV